MGGHFTLTTDTYQLNIFLFKVDHICYILVRNSMVLLAS